MKRAPSLLRLALAAVVLASAAAAGPAFAETAVLRGLDKVTGHARDFRATAGEPVQFGSLRITVRSCEKRPAEETPEVSVYLEIEDTAPVRTESNEDAAAAPSRLFAGWMFASSPGLNALQHAVYDVWAIDCRS
ncbi:MAG: DUF2155 domain-containing protein [Caulobacterales bacterium]